MRKILTPAWRGSACVALMLVLSACALDPDYRAPAADGLVPAGYPAQATDLPVAGAVAPASAWWRAFGDPVLDGLVDAALASSPDLVAAEWRVAQARALAEAAGAQYYPQASIDGRVGRDELSRNGENLALIPFKPAHTTFTDYRIGFDASWELDLFGHTRRQAEAAAARAGSVEQSRADARVVIAAETARGYLEYRTALRRLAVARASEAAYAKTAELVGLQHAAGIASDLDLSRAQTDAIASSAVSPALEADRRAALFRLSSLTGLPVADVDARLGGTVGEPAAPPGVPAGLPSDLLLRRPDLRRAERDLAAATADAGVAAAERFPRISLVGDLGLDSVHPGDLTQAASRYWNFGPQVSVPVFSAGRLRSQSRAADAAREAALASYRSSVLNALADVETALVRYGADVRRSQALQEAGARIEGARSLTRLRYEAGEATLLEVMDAERAVQAVGDQRAAVDGQVGLDYVALQKALGGGW